MKYLSKYVDIETLDGAYKMLDHIQITVTLFLRLTFYFFDMMKYVESVQQKAALITTRCIKETNTQKLYNELGCGSLEESAFLENFLYFIS